MTWTTSSAESETVSAGKLQAVDVAAGAGDLSPTAVAPGRCTSRGVGRGAARCDGAFDVTAAPTISRGRLGVFRFEAHPGANHGVIVDDKDADGHCVPVGAVSSEYRARHAQSRLIAARQSTDRGASRPCACARRWSRARRGGRPRWWRVESFAVVLHEGLDDAGAHLDVVSRRGTVARRSWRARPEPRRGKLARAGPHVPGDDADRHTIAALGADNGLGDGSLEESGGLRVACRSQARSSHYSVERGAHARILGRADQVSVTAGHCRCAYVGALSLLHPLRLDADKSCAATWGRAQERHRQPGRTNEAATQQDDGRVVTRGGR